MKFGIYKHKKGGRYLRLPWDSRDACDAEAPRQTEYIQLFRGNYPRYTSWRRSLLKFREPDYKKCGFFESIVVLITHFWR